MEKEEEEEVAPQAKRPRNGECEEDEEYEDEEEEDEEEEEEDTYFTELVLGMARFFVYAIVLLCLPVNHNGDQQLSSEIH